MHPLLTRQLRRVLGSDHTDPATWPAPLPEMARLVDAAYLEADADRKMVERSMEIASQELGARNAQLTAKNRELEAAEQNLRRAFDDMEQRVRARTRELQVAMEQTQAASRAKSEFLANMSHEIRTPMSAILGYADMLLAKETSREQRLEYTQTIRRQGQHLLSVLNDILDLSKIEANKLQVERIPCDLCQIISEALSLMRVRAIEKKLQCELIFAGLIPDVIHTDPTRLRQILLNLIGNAIKFTAQGKIQVVVSVLEPQTPSARLQIQVIDSGIGMTAEQMTHLFTPFAQGDGSTTRRFGGSGLGLSICQRLAQMLGGDIQVESRADRGSCFTATVMTGDLTGVRCTVRSQEVLRPQPAADTGAAGHHGTQAGRVLAGLRILLAEDGEHNQRVFSFYLTGAGASVTTAENGRVACQKVQDADSAGTPFHLVLMDMQMPELDGYGATARLRTYGYQSPVIALTIPHAMAGDREKCLAAGCTDYLTKPVDRRHLLEMVAGHAGLARPEENRPVAVPAIAVPSAAGRLRSRADDPDLLPFIPGFIADLPRQFASLVRLARLGDIEGLARVLHSLKGSGSMFGYPELSDQAVRTEESLLAARAIDAVRAELAELAGLMRCVDGFDDGSIGPELLTIFTQMRRDHAENIDH